MTRTFAELYEMARAVARPRRLSEYAEAGDVGAALLTADGRVLPPCGRCREFIAQLDDRNFAAEVKVSANEVVTLRELLPHDWRDALKTKP